MTGVGEATLWRVFPWDPTAVAGHPFSPSYVPEATGRGRFDLPGRLSPVLYLAGTPDHAVAELLHPWRGRRIDERHLRRAGRPLAVVQVTTRESGPPVADLCDPDVLVRLGIPPDRIASRLRSLTQPIARTVWDSGAPGLRWWSRFWGDWQATVRFMARSPTDRSPEGEVGPVLHFGTPVKLSLESPAVREAASALGIELRGS